MDFKAELLKRLDALAQQLGTSVNYLWHVLVKQGLVQGGTDLMISLFLLILSMIALHYAKIGYREGPKDRNERGEWPDRYITLSAIGTLSSALLFGMFMGWLYYGLQEVLNPEYYALKELLNAIK
jgi:cytochrome bd-type quinol oxidase subunit 2